MQTPTLSKEQGLDVVQPTTPRPSRLLFWLPIVLAVALVTLATWMVLDRFVFAPPPADEIVTVVDDTIAAWRSGDADAIGALYAEDAIFESGGVAYEGPATIGGYAHTQANSGAASLRRVGPTVVVDDTSVTPIHSYETGSWFAAAGVWVIQVDADGRIVRHSVVEVRPLD